ncbi:MAG: acyltransferase [Geminicoccaceae bacterium]
MYSLRQWIKGSEHPLAQHLYGLAKARHRLAVPVIPLIHHSLYVAALAIRTAWATFTRIVWWTPLLQARLEAPASGLQLSSGLPLIMGPLRLRLGRDCQMSGQSTLTARPSSAQKPELIVGDRVVMNWQTTVAVGSRVVIGDDVMMGGRNYLAGYPGHPLDPADRAAGLPDTPDQVGDIIIEDRVWLGMGVTVTAGVRIGAGTVVAAGSVVTKDLPPNVLAGGMPARVVRLLNNQSEMEKS